MSRTYKVTGINLKSQPFGESDRLVTILTKECGLIKAIAPGARKPHSSLGGRSGMFVVNELLIAKGKTLDKITQAQTVQTYPNLGKDLAKLAGSQYLAELVLCQAMNDHPQVDLYVLLNEHLTRLNGCNQSNSLVVLALLVHGVFQFLAIAGLTPQIDTCCLSQKPLVPDPGDENWQVGFSISAGGAVSLLEWKRRRKQANQHPSLMVTEAVEEYINSSAIATADNGCDYNTIIHHEEVPPLSRCLNIREFSILQNLSHPQILELNLPYDRAWLSVERLLRQYAQYQFGRQIRSAALIDSYFAAHYDATI